MTAVVFFAAVSVYSPSTTLAAKGAILLHTLPSEILVTRKTKIYKSGNNRRYTKMAYHGTSRSPPAGTGIGTTSASLSNMITPDGNEDSTNIATVLFGSAAMTATPTLATSFGGGEDDSNRIDGDDGVYEEDDYEEGTEQVDLPSKLIAVLDVIIVGIRYYNGVAHPGEFVTLVREKNNPYDKNAIRIDNLEGDKIGHIKGIQVAALI